MRISIIGYSASGKSTFAKQIGEILNLPILHLDKVNFLANWKEREVEESKKIVADFIKNNKNFVIEGNFYKFSLERFKLSDKIIFFNFDRITCLCQAIERYNTYRGKVRESMSEGCYEKLDLEFLYWILIGGRTKDRIERYNKMIQEYKDKIIVVHNRGEVNKLLEKIKLNKTLENINFV